MRATYFRLRAGLRSAAAAAVAAAVVTGCGSDAGGEVRVDGDLVAARVVNVEVLAVVEETFEDVIGITGVVEAERDVTVAAEESGVIRELYVEKGRAVRAGQPLARIDDRVLRAQYDQARSEAALARETFERQRRLWEDEQIGSEMNFLRAKYGAETADANARMLAARLERTVVRAPIGGVLDARYVEVGAMVASGSPVARIIDVDTLKVTGGVPERYAGDIRSGASAAVVFDNMPGQEYAGSTRFVGSAIMEQNRTFPVEVAIPNRGGSLKPGMVARVRLARGAARPALLVPREAVLRTESGYSVFVIIEEAGRLIAHATPVITGPGGGNRVVIESGLAAGDRVVVVGQHQVSHGDHVAIVERQGSGS
jgi:membrane fusion protein, multidrug efflux system